MGFAAWRTGRGEASAVTQVVSMHPRHRRRPRVHPRRCLSSGPERRAVDAARTAATDPGTARPPAGVAAARVDRRGPVPGSGGLPVARCSGPLRTVVAGVRAVLVLAVARDLDTA